MNLKLKTVPRFSGSNPKLPAIVSSSRTAGCSMNGIDWEIFMLMRGAVRGAEERETLGPATEAPKPGTVAVNTKPIILVLVLCRTCGEM